MSKKIAVLTLFLCFAAAQSVFAKGENLSLKIAVMGPGNELYFWFGHIALIIEDSNTGESRFYDYGLFSFDNDDFFVNFAFGRMLYSSGVSPTDRNLAVYKHLGRSITIYALDIPPEDRQRVFEFVEFNTLPENRDYYYHIFKDNCCTRIRDIIDIATNGQFGGQFKDAPGRFTFREHVRRHMWFSPIADWILNFWMGQVVDVPITVWQEMFLPAEVGNLINEFYYTDESGVRRKLVSSVDTVFEVKNRPAVLDTPPPRWSKLLIFSLLLTAVFGFFFFLQAKNYRAGRILAGIGMSLTGFVFGFSSLLLYFMNLFTNHDYTYQNFNMLFGTPLLLAVVPFGLMFALTKKAEKQLFYSFMLRLLWLIAAAGVLVSMLLKPLPGIYQQNLGDQLLFLPLALTFALQPVGLREIVQKYLKRSKGNGNG